MKKVKNAYFLCFCLVIMTLSACQQKFPQDTPPVESTTPSLTDGSVDADSIEWIAPTDDIDMNGMNLFWQHDNIQFTADDNAKLSLYVNAVKNEDGDFSFDDRQEWVLLMETSLGNYPLFSRQYVQLGGVSCIVFNDYIESNTISHVLVTVQQTAGYQLYDCVFDNDKEAFKVTQVYDAQGINFITGSN